MRILIYNAYHGDNTNTRFLCDDFKSICNSCGIEYTEVKFSNKLFHCSGCGACAKTLHCVMKDEISEINWSLYQAIVIVSPIYFFGFSSRAKVFLDRLYSVNLDNKVITAIMPSGSAEYYGGFDIVQDVLERTCDYCGCTLVQPFNKVTNDKVTRVSKSDYKSLCEMAKLIVKEVEQIESSKEENKGEDCS